MIAKHPGDAADVEAVKTHVSCRSSHEATLLDSTASQDAALAT
jgi:hypothetical protein